MNIRKMTNILAIPFCSCLMAFNCVAQDSQSWGNAEDGFVLRYHLDKGTKFTITSTATTEAINNQMGAEVTTTIDDKSEEDFEVISADEKSGMTLEMEFIQRTQNLKSLQAVLSADFAELMGKKVKLTVSPTGTTDALEGFDELPVVMSAAQEKLTKELHEITVKEYFHKLPDKPVKFGDTWTKSEEVELPMEGGMVKITNETTYTLVEEIVKDGIDCLKIESASTASMSGNIEQKGVPLKLTRETKGTDTIYFAYKKGMYLGREISGKAEGTVTVEPMNMDIQQKLNTNIVLTVTFK